jgi:glutamate formiminotransferase / formiminotetrahydrofolate cyclodeaminase
MKKLIECVPNFSEGRDRAKMDAIVSAMREVEGVYLLDFESDIDHNRSVVTLAGEPEPVAEAAIRGVGKALELLDLTKHQGAHPRLGATDVVPFIPIEGVTLDDCVALAKRVGREIWKRYQIPVYFYEAAAERPERANLENIRKGQFEGLLEEVPKNPARAPDVGDPRLHPTAGAVVVGARKFLIAYNINLNTPDLEIAKRIAKNIRFSNGGLRYVKAMGVDLRARHLAQVSINMTDFEQTPLHRVFEMVKREAERYGVLPVGSEIAGLIPKRALELTADFYLQLENFSPAQVLENRLAESLMKAATPGGEAAGSSAGSGTGPSNGSLDSLIKPLLDKVAAPTATPGGGAVAALSGAFAASLGEMVAGLSRKKKAQAQFVPELSEALADFEAATKSFARAADQDSSAFEKVMAAYKLPKESQADQSHRSSAIRAGLEEAAEVPMGVARHGVALYERLVQLQRISAASMLSDLQVARFMVIAAIRGALANVEINIQSLKDEGATPATLEKLRNEADSLKARIGSE